jgi:hypothetical protein
MTLLILVIAILLISLAYSVITSPKETAFTAFFFNDTGDSSDTTLIDGFVDYIGVDTKKESCYIDATMNYTEDQSDYSSYLYVEKVMAEIAAEDLDVIVGDELAVKYYAKLECFSNVTEILPDDLLDKFSDKLYYATVGESDELVPVGIYITDAPKINENYYYVDKEPIMGFIVNSNNTDNSIEFLRYIYLEDE